MDLQKIFFTVLPKNLMSQAFGFFARVEILGFRQLFRNVFIRMFKIDTKEAEFPVQQYKTVQDFFIRKLRNGVRPIESTKIVSPVDGVLSQTGIFTDDSLPMVQAKGKNYSLRDIVPDQDDAFYNKFIGGEWATIYLAPFNYHRIHSPFAGEVYKINYVPGNLWPVNRWSVNAISELFCVNERVSSIMRTVDGHEAVVVKVGATNVGRISLSYTKDIVTNTKNVPSRSRPVTWTLPKPVSREIGSELGIFELGSTVVILLSKSAKETLKPDYQKYLNRSVKMGNSFESTEKANT